MQKLEATPTRAHYNYSTHISDEWPLLNLAKRKRWHTLYSMIIDKKIIVDKCSAYASER